MKILALEFSSNERSVAILDADDTTRTKEDLQRIDSGTGKTLQLIDELLRASNMARKEVGVIAVGLGPGSYAGIRAGIALAQGWELGRSVKLIGVSSAGCIAAQAWTEGVRGKVLVVIDAQRGEFYLTNYELTAASWRETKVLRLGTKQEVTDCEASGDLVIGPEVAPVFQNGRLVWPRAITLARLARGRSDFIRGQDMQPLYLRQTNFVKAPPPRRLPE